MRQGAHFMRYFMKRGSSKSIKNVTHERIHNRSLKYSLVTMKCRVGGRKRKEMERRSDCIRRERTQTGRWNRVRRWKDETKGKRWKDELWLGWPRWAGMKMRWERRLKRGNKWKADELWRQPRVRRETKRQKLSPGRETMRRENTATSGEGGRTGGGRSSERGH